MVRFHFPLPKGNDLKRIIDNLKSLYKYFTYSIFLIFYGKIKGKILARQDKRIKILPVTKEKKINYHIYEVSQGRLYTDRVHDTAILLDNFIVDGPSQQLRPIDNAPVEENIVFEKGTPRIKKKINGTVLSLLTGGAGNDNYSHWLYDVLPRIALCENVINLSKIDYYLAPSLKNNYQKETLELLGINKNQLISSENYRHFESSKLIVSDHPYCISGSATKDIMNIPQWISRWLREKLLITKKNEMKFPKKFYIDRSDSKSNTRHLRKIINENEVKDLLKKNGFEFIQLGKLNFKDQTKIFNNADIIVGLHGAGFANLCFCEQKTKIIELRGLSSGTQYKNLADKNKLEYQAISCEPIKHDAKNQYGHINVPIEALEKLVKI